MVEVPIEYILVFVTAMFIPLVIYLMRNINEQAKNSARMDIYDEHLKDTKDIPTTIELMKQRLVDLENDVKELFNKIRRNNNYNSSNEK